jgi:hypothetical protein
MNPTDPRTQAAFAAAISHIKTTADAVADRVADLLGTLASTNTRIHERDALIGAQLDLRRQMSTFVLVFSDTFSKKVSRETAPSGDSTRRLADTDWHSLSLVDDAEVEERMFADRISQTITHGCEWELRELAAFTGALLGIGRADQDRNPFRPEIIGVAVFQAIEAVSKDPEGRKLLAREIGAALGKVMPSCYSEIIGDMKARGVVPVSLSVRSVEGPGNEIADRVISGYATLRDTAPGSGGSGFGPTSVDDYGGGVPSSRGGGQGGGSGGAGRSGSAWSPSGGAGGATGPGGSSRGHSSRSSSRPGVSAQADAELMTLLRRLTVLATRPSDLGPSSGSSGLPSAADIDIASGLGRNSGSGVGSYLDSLPGLMAVNLIRAHRDELRQASTGTLDHMVIDVVGSLFDQILSDSRVPPQMARQIARLQLPVLRVALGDPTFFSSRKHPVRRFVNRIASLACAFDEFDEGPGKPFLLRVRNLVQEIVEGDFDQIDVYTSKLNELEQFIASQSRDEVQGNAQAVSLLDGKESDLRVQQRYMLQLQSALTPISMQDYLREFLSQVWSQALALSSKRDGPQAERTQRFKRVGRDLVMSVQPKGSPMLRKKFLMQLPMLMKDLNEGMALIGWPDAAQKSFFGKLLPAHAESLKGAPISELEYNLLAKQLEGVFNTPVPEADAMLRDVPLADSSVSPIEPQFSDEEKKRIGLVEEAAVDWSGEIDIDLSAEGGDTRPGGLDADTGTETSPIGLDIGLDINLDLSPTELPEPSKGPQLIDHLRIGFAYQMHLNDQWQKVRLNYVSPGRAFFVFTRGRRHQETVSLTSRMLARLCETGRFRAFENSYLLERATARARKQLAALSTAAKSPTALPSKH